MVPPLACALGGLARPFARSPVPPDRPETCENHRETTKIIGTRPKTTKIDQNHGQTTKNALARSPVAKSGPVAGKATHERDSITDASVRVDAPTTARQRAEGPRLMITENTHTMHTHNAHTQCTHTMQAQYPRCTASLDFPPPDRRSPYRARGPGLPKVSQSIPCSVLQLGT